MIRLISEKTGKTKDFIKFYETVGFENALTAAKKILGLTQDLIILTKSEPKRFYAHPALVYKIASWASEEYGFLVQELLHRTDFMVLKPFVRKPRDM